MVSHTGYRMEKLLYPSKAMVSTVTLQSLIVAHIRQTAHTQLLLTRLLHAVASLARAAIDKMIFRAP